jgi:hypothetical protein
MTAVMQEKLIKAISYDRILPDNLIPEYNKLNVHEQIRVIRIAKADRNRRNKQ